MNEKDQQLASRRRPLIIGISTAARSAYTKLVATKLWVKNAIFLMHIIANLANATFLGWIVSNQVSDDTDHTIIETWRIQRE